MHQLKRAAKAVLPHGLVRYVQHTRQNGHADSGAFHANREAAMAEFLRTIPVNPGTPYSFDDSVQFVHSLGVPKTHILEGSMPVESLQAVRTTIQSHLPGKPLRALHVGNFVGISLAFLTNTVKQLHADSLVVSVDPNLTHRGVVSPMSIVLKLLQRYNLLGSSMVLVGYSSKKSISNDGMSVVAAGYDPYANFNNEVACESQIDLLARLAGPAFDVVLLDGNHESAYLQRELQSVDAILAPGGLIVLDDVSEHWQAICSIYEQTLTTGYRELFRDGRIGIIAKAE